MKKYSKQNKKQQPSSKKDAFSRFINQFIQKDSLYEEDKLNEFGEIFCVKAKEVRETIGSFNQAISPFPFMVIIYLWAYLLGKNPIFGEKYLSIMWELIENNIVPLQRKSHPITIEEFIKLNPIIVEHIRCFDDWSFEKRELYAEFYCEFSYWMSKQTFGLIAEANDVDRESTRKRKIPFDTYVKFLSALELRERILAKIFYLGGDVALEDVLSIKIEDLDFEEFSIRIGGTPVYYPMHLLKDIKRFIGERKKGFIFLGRQNNRINHTVPYRALKAVATKLGFDSRFTFKEFIKNQ